MRTTEEKARQVDRRRLLKGAGLALGAVAATGAVAAKDAVAGTAAAKPVRGGYRESDEVRTYYKLARF
jgi:nitrous oxide reductase